MIGDPVRLLPAGLEHDPSRAGQIGKVAAVWDCMTGILWPDGSETFVLSKWLDDVPYRVDRTGASETRRSPNPGTDRPRDPRC